MRKPPRPAGQNDRLITIFIFSLIRCHFCNETISPRKPDTQAPTALTKLRSNTNAASRVSDVLKCRTKTKAKREVFRSLGAPIAQSHFLAAQYVSILSKYPLQVTTLPLAGAGASKSTPFALVSQDMTNASLSGNAVTVAMLPIS